jgi:hypothetical protein
MEEIKEILESSPKEYGSRYIPTEFVILAGQISGQLGPLYQKTLDIIKAKNFNPERDVDDRFSDSDKQNIRNCRKKMLKILDGEDKNKYEECLKDGRYSDEIRLLYDLISSRYRKEFSSSLEIIEGLYLQISSISLNDIKDDEENDDEEDYNSDDNASPAVDKERVIKERRLFAEKFLEPKFNSPDEKDFIRYIAEEGDWSTLVNEFNRYKNEPKTHKNDSLIFKVYSGGRKNCDHTKFTNKIIIALKKYEKWLEEAH